MKNSGQKVLLIRFSSLGDVIQTLSVAHRLSEIGEVHWITREDFKDVVAEHPQVTRAWAVDRKMSPRQWLQLLLQLRREQFTHVYDAHRSLRSLLICLGLLRFSTKILRKSQKRWLRFLLFQFRIDLYPKPRSGQRDLLEPLGKWGLSKNLPPPPQIHVPPQAQAKIRTLLDQNSFQNFVVLCPSSAHALKRWPPEYWNRLIELRPDQKFVLLGGPEDLFCEDLARPFGTRVLNLAGKTNLHEAGAVIGFSDLVIANDTGLLHIAEQRGHPTIALMGPAPFGFPSRPTTKILELELKCRPCSKHGQGPCTNPEFQKCLRGISPEQVAKELDQFLLKVQAQNR